MEQTEAFKLCKQMNNIIAQLRYEHTYGDETYDSLSRSTLNGLIQLTVENLLLYYEFRRKDDTRAESYLQHARKDAVFFIGLCDILLAPQQKVSDPSAPSDVRPADTKED